MTKKKITLTLTKKELKNLWGYCQDRRIELEELLKNKNEWFEKYRLIHENELNQIDELQKQLVKEYTRVFLK